MATGKAKAKKEPSNFSRILTSINQKTQRVEPEEFKKVKGFIISKVLSYRKDLLFVCNEINKYGSISEEATYRFYLGVVPKNKRYAGKTKWDEHPDLALIIEYYNCNKNIANEYLKLMTTDDIEFVRKKCFKGGVINK